MNIIIFIIILLVLVVSHEFGHFIVAKKAGIRVDEFAFGFKPRLWSIKKGETTYSINALPIGGYVSIFGENPNDENTNGPDRDRSFVHKPKYIQALVLVAGVVMNFLVAWLLFTVGFMTGLPSSVTNAPVGSNITNAELAVTSVLKDSPAEIAGLKTGDRIKQLYVVDDMTEVPSIESLKYFIRKHSTENITVEFTRKSTEMKTNIVPKAGLVEGEAGIGIGMDMIGTLKLPIHKALWQGLKLSANVFVATVVGFYTLIHNAVIGQGDMSAVTGPVGIVGVVGNAMSFGFVYLLSFTALISINLAVINLIPFPALDGGRLLFLLIEKIKGSRIKPKIANVVNFIGFCLLMLLMIVVTFNDIKKLF
ncbi:RIP metalloprotease RseP [Candidatus Nomurabacteria bacterium]|nr:RIP metalloprotease RseP [Candidatus Nomurabacteria bacterium]